MPYFYEKKFGVMAQAVLYAQRSRRSEVEEVMKEAVEKQRLAVEGSAVGSQPPK